MESVNAIRRRLEERKERHESSEIEKLLHEGFRESLKALSEKVEFDVASLYVYLKHQKCLRKMADFRGGVNFIERIRFDHGYGLSAWVAKNQQQIYLPDIHRGSRHGHAPVRSYLSMPVLIQDELVGVVNFAHIKPNAFERHEMLVIKNYIESIKPIFQIYHKHQNTQTSHEEKNFNHR